MSAYFRDAAALIVVASFIATAGVWSTVLHSLT